MAYQDHNGQLSFTMDAWTSPNHCMFVAFVVHFVQEGMPMSFPLDMIEVPKVSSLEWIQYIAYLMWG